MILVLLPNIASDQWGRSPLLTAMAVLGCLVFWPELLYCNYGFLACHSIVITSAAFPQLLLGYDHFVSFVPPLLASWFQTLCVIKLQLICDAETQHPDFGAQRSDALAASCSRTPVPTAARLWALPMQQAGAPRTKYARSMLCPKQYIEQMKICSIW
jgi:hypothetical protein